MYILPVQHKATTKILPLAFDFKGMQLRSVSYRIKLIGQSLDTPHKYTHTHDSSDKKYVPFVSRENWLWRSACTFKHASARIPLSKFTSSAFIDFPFTLWTISCDRRYCERERESVSRFTADYYSDFIEPRIIVSNRWLRIDHLLVNHALVAGV